MLPAENGNAVQDLVNYNPYSLSPLTSQWLYEPLMLQNQYTCAFVPWLVTKYAFPSADTLVLTVRQGVRWSDGQAFTAPGRGVHAERGEEVPGHGPVGALDRCLRQQPPPPSPRAATP